MKPGNVMTVWLDLDAITDPIHIGKMEPGGRLMPVGGTGEKAMCFLSKRGGIGKGAGQNNSRRGRQQRRRKSAK